MHAIFTVHVLVANVMLNSRCTSNALLQFKHVHPLARKEVAETWNVNIIEQILRHQSDTMAENSNLFCHVVTVTSFLGCVSHLQLNLKNKLIVVLVRGFRTEYFNKKQPKNKCSKLFWINKTSISPIKGNLLNFLHAFKLFN